MLNIERLHGSRGVLHLSFLGSGLEYKLVQVFLNVAQLRTTLRGKSVITLLLKRSRLSAQTMRVDLKRACYV